MYAPLTYLHVNHSIFILLEGGGGGTNRGMGHQRFQNNALMHTKSFNNFEFHQPG